jgi:hypothetical protein
VETSRRIVGHTDVGRSTDGVGPTGSQRVGSKWMAATEAELNSHAVYESGAWVVDTRRKHTSPSPQKPNGPARSLFTSNVRAIQGTHCSKEPTPGIDWYCYCVGRGSRENDRAPEKYRDMPSLSTLSNDRSRKRYYDQWQSASHFSLHCLFLAVLQTGENAYSYLSAIRGNRLGLPVTKPKLPTSPNTHQQRVNSIQ